MRRKTILERLENFIIPVTETGCWLWIGAWEISGYGAITVGDFSYKAHRLVWETFRGPIPAGLLVCHKCDIRPCVNPDHLFLGTQLDNIKDCKSKGRFHGQRQTHCKRGHEYKPSDTYIDKRRGWTMRNCSACRIFRRNTPMTQPTSAAQKVGHTPGPWFLLPNGSDVGTREPDYESGKPSYWTTAYANRLREEWRANAVLIALAPEMLAELKTVSWLLADLSPDGLVKRQIDALIARATRESEDV